jgi:NAD(P)-dependent dehydrogenase (short-subunit alcohol dehydrogenase family)
MTGRSIIVTGGFGALGRVTAAAFAAKGDKVARVDFAPQQCSDAGLPFPASSDRKTERLAGAIGLPSTERCCDRVKAYGSIIRGGELLSLERL